MAMATAAFAGTATDKTLGYREYTVYEPSIKYTSSLILAMHPGLSYSSAWRNALPTDPVPGLDNTMDVIADETGTTVVYPQGYYFAWNAKSPRCCGYTSDINVPDIDYLERVIADVAQDYDLDSTSVYFAGYSNGGMMSMSYACAHPEQVKGIVSASGPMMVDQDECPAFPNIPVIYINGSDDTTVPPAGGHSAASNRIYPAAQDVLDFLIASGANVLHIPVDGASHDWDSIVDNSRSEKGIVYASVTGALVNCGSDMQQ